MRIFRDLRTYLQTTRMRRPCREPRRDRSTPILQARKEKIDNFAPFDRMKLTKQDFESEYELQDRKFRRPPTVHFKYSLAQLFFGMTVWAVCLGTIPVFFPLWLQALLAVAAAIAIVIVCGRCQSFVGIAFLSFPLVCVLNWSSYSIGLAHVFGETGMVPRLLGPIAAWVSWPVVVMQNSVPLTRPWDTLFGIATISLMEVGVLILLIIVWRKLTAYKPT